jgi:hypothetical protein
MTNHRKQALRRLAEAFSEYSGVDLGPALTCREADALAYALEVAGAGVAADALMDAHAESDDEGDSHYPQGDLELASEA